MRNIKRYKRNRVIYVIKICYGVYNYVGKQLKKINSHLNKNNMRHLIKVLFLSFTIIFFNGCNKEDDSGPRKPYYQFNNED